MIYFLNDTSESNRLDIKHIWKFIKFLVTNCFERNVFKKKRKDINVKFLIFLDLVKFTLDIFEFSQFYFL